VATLMDQQSKIPPTVLTRAELARMGQVVRDSLDRLQEVGMPDTLGHLDLNPGNIIASPRKCVFLDWAEACVGHPLFSLQYLIEHLRRTVGRNSAMEARAIEAYCAAWVRVVPRAAIAEALELAPLLAVFAYAAGTDMWRDPERLEQPAIAGYLRSLTRRMHREAGELERRRSVCVG
jgi:aminoglycoside phosphotransferase (APT) family kinase protein